MNLSVKIFLALVLSVVVGLIAGPDALPFIKWWIAPIGTMFINLIKMMIVPVVFTSLIVGMTSIHRLRRRGALPSGHRHEHDERCRRRGQEGAVPHAGARRDDPGEPNRLHGQG